MAEDTTLHEDDIVLCTVKRIEGATVFLDIEGHGEGSMMLSEVAAGRIRNLREYVVPNKVIVCKVLRIQGNNVQLSLRRVTGGERDEVMERYKKARVLSNMLKPVLKDKTKATLAKIKEKYELADFLDDARENPELLKPFVSSPEFEKLEPFFADKKERDKTVHETITVTCDEPNGVIAMQETLRVAGDEAEIHYKGSSKFSIATKAKDFRAANAIMHAVIEKIKDAAKKHKVHVEHKSK